MRKRFLVVLALAMVFSLVLSSVAMAAPEGNKISNELELTVTVEEEVEMGTIKVNDDLATISVKGLWDVFSVSTQPPEGYNGNVKGKVEVVNGNINGFKLEYLEQGGGPNHGKFFEMTFDNNEAYFGPAEGFPWQVVDDSIFRVTWLAADNYEFKLSIMGGEGFGTELASDTVTVNVAEGNAVALTHSINGELTSEPVSTTVNEGETMDYEVAAQLVGDVSHVDGTLYICDVQKEDGDNWTAASSDDFEIIKVDGDENTQGINKTFTQEGDILRGYWGPPAGFTLDEQKDTKMTIKFNNAGTYKVKVYAIQVTPVESIQIQ